MNNPHRNNPKYAGKKRSGDFTKMTSDRPSRGGFTKFGGPKPATELYKAVCAECGVACEVPFKPNGKKPILCRPCFKGTEDKSEHRSSALTKSYGSTNSYKKDFDQLNKKLDQILRALNA